MVTPAPSSTRPDETAMCDEARVGRAHDRLDRRVGLVDRAHHQRAAAKESGRRVPRQRAGRVGQSRESFTVMLTRGPPLPRLQ